MRGLSAHTFYLFAALLALAANQNETRADVPVIVIEGYVRFTNNFGIRDVAISNSLDTSVTYSDLNGYYKLVTQSANVPQNFPFILYLAKPGLRPLSIAITDPRLRLDFLIPAGQAHNDFSNRVHITTLNFSNPYDTSQGCDVEAGEQGVGGASVWYSYVAPQDGTIRLRAESRQMRPEFTFFTGMEIATLSRRPAMYYSNYVEHRSATTAEVTVHGGEELQIRISGQTRDASAPAGGSFTWSLNFTPNYPLLTETMGKLAGTIFIDQPTNAPGNRYLPGTVVHLSATTNWGFFFAGWSGALNSTDPEITVVMDGMKAFRANFGVVNDHFGDAFVLGDLPASARGLNAYATKEPGEPNHNGQPGGNSVWWRWTAPSNMSVQLDFEFVRFTPLIAIYTGNSVSNLDLVTNNERVRNKRVLGWDALGGSTYHIVVDGFYGDVSFDFSFVLSLVAEARYWLAWEVQGDGTVAFDPLPDGNAQYGAGDVVALYAVPLNTNYFSGWVDVSSGKAVPIGTANPLVVQMTKDEHIRAVFDPVGDAAIPRRLARRPPNDSFTNRTVLLQRGLPAFGSHRRATRERGEPLHAGGSSQHSLWWSWTAHSGSLVNVMAQADFDAAVAIYTGDTLTNLTPVASTRFGPTNALYTVTTFTASAGVTYQVAVSAFRRGKGSTALYLAPE